MNTGVNNAGYIGVPLAKLSMKEVRSRHKFTLFELVATVGISVSVLLAGMMAGVSQSWAIATLTCISLVTLGVWLGPIMEKREHEYEQTSRDVKRHYGVVTSIEPALQTAAPIAAVSRALDFSHTRMKHLGKIGLVNNQGEKSFVDDVYAYLEEDASITLNVKGGTGGSVLVPLTSADAA